MPSCRNASAKGTKIEICVHWHEKKAFCFQSVFAKVCSLQIEIVFATCLHV